MTSAGFNLANDASCGLTAPTDLASTDPLLVSGRPTAGSAAVDSIPTGTPTLCDRTPLLDHDAAGAPRPQGGGCERGAFEVTVAAPPVVVTVDSPLDQHDAAPR